MTTSRPTAPGAFLQLIEYHTERPEEMADIIQRWSDAIGAKRTARWFSTTADRERPGHFVQLVEFPSYDAAMVNSRHPATDEFARELRDLGGETVVFRNLDVVAAEHF